MKLFRVVYEEDGRTIKEPGVVETAIHRCELRYAAEDIEQVWEAIEYIRADPERTLIVLHEEAPLVTVLERAAPLEGGEDA